MNLIMNGALGRMGIRIITLALDTPDIHIAGAVEFAGHPDIGHFDSWSDRRPVPVRWDAGFVVLNDFPAPSQLVCRSSNPAQAMD